MDDVVQRFIADTGEYVAAVDRATAAAREFARAALEASAASHAGFGGDSAGLASLVRNMDRVEVHTHQAALALEDIYAQLRDGIPVTRAAAAEAETAAGWFSKLIGQASIPLPMGLPALSGPAAIAAVAAGLVALPFLAQAAAGAITLGLGGALTGIGIYAASKSADVKKSFHDLTAAFAKDFGGIGTPFNKAVEGILKTTQDVLPSLARTFTAAITPIAGPLEAFGQTLARTFAGRQVADSLKAVGDAFGGILRALTPQLPGDFAAVADGFTNIARAIARNPKPIADFISGIAHVTGALLDVIAWLTQVAAYLEMHFIPAWQRTLKFLEQWGHDIVATNENVWHHITSVFDGIRHDVALAWDATWNNTIGRLSRGVSDANRLLSGWVRDVGHYIDDVARFFGALPGRIVHALGDVGHLLWSAGVALVEGLIGGVQSMVGSLFSAIGNMASGALSAAKHFLGIGSPSRETYQHGVWLMEGYAAGIRDHAYLVREALVSSLGFTGLGGAGLAPAGAGASWSAPSVHVTIPLTLSAGAGTADPRFLQYLQTAVQEAVLRYTTLNPGTTGLAQVTPGVRY